MPIKNAALVWIRSFDRARFDLKNALSKRNEDRAFQLGGAKMAGFTIPYVPTSA